MSRVKRRSQFGGLLTIVTLLVLCASSLCVSSASAGQIVYKHGGDAWAMNEDGTAPHALVTEAQAGVSGIYNPSVDPVGGAVAFSGTTLAPDGNCEVNCDGLYTLVGGALARLSGPPANCISPGTECETFAENPSVTTNGRVAYLAEAVFGSIGFGATTTTTLDEVPLNGSEAPAPWGLPPQSLENGYDDPNLFYTVASDPANPNLLAYEGESNCTYSGKVDTGASPASSSTTAKDRVPTTSPTTTSPSSGSRSAPTASTSPTSRSANSAESGSTRTRTSKTRRTTALGAGGTCWKTPSRTPTTAATPTSTPSRA